MYEYRYFDIISKMATESFNMVSTLADKGSNLQVLLPWMSKEKTTMSRFPLREICLHRDIMGPNKRSVFHV